MRELSLHLLDLIENSIRAKATVVSITLTVSSQSDELRMRIEDNGPGFSAPAQVVVDPFYTTKEGKKTGLGLSLLQSAAQRAGGGLTVGRSSLGGASVEVHMRLSHLDRGPLGDLAGTFSAAACANQEVDLRLCMSSEAGRLLLSTRQLAEDLPHDRRSGLSVAREMSKRIKAGAGQVWPGDA